MQLCDNSVQVKKKKIHMNARMDMADRMGSLTGVQHSDGLMEGTALGSAGSGRNAAVPHA